MRVATLYTVKSESVIVDGQYFSFRQLHVDNGEYITRRGTQETVDPRNVEKYHLPIKCYVVNGEKKYYALSPELETIVYLEKQEVEHRASSWEYKCLHNYNIIRELEESNKSFLWRLKNLFKRDLYV